MLWSAGNVDQSHRRWRWWVPEGIEDNDIIFVVKSLNTIKAILSEMTSDCAVTVQMREESESGIRKWEEMWFKMTAEDGERGGQQWRAMEDCSTDEWLQQETLSCCCCRDKPIRQCLCGRQVLWRDEEFHQIHIVVKYIFDVNAVTEMTLTFHCPLGHDRSKCSAVFSPLPQCAQIGDVIRPIKAG